MCEGEGGGCTQRDFTGAAHTWVGWGGWGGDEMSTKSTEVADISSWMNKFNIFGMTSKYGDHWNDYVIGRDQNEIFREEE